MGNDEEVQMQQLWMGRKMDDEGLRPTSNRNLQRLWSDQSHK